MSKLSTKPLHKSQFNIGDVVRHRFFSFRGVIFDIDSEFNNTEEWWQAIPADVRPRKDQPFYHLLAENDEIEYVAYVSEQNLLIDHADKPLRHPDINQVFDFSNGRYLLKNSLVN